MSARKPERIPSIKAVMTPFPWQVQVEDPLVRARELMLSRDIRHLPVTDGDALIGVITARDIALVENATPDAAERAALTVRDVSVRDAYVVELSEPVDHVLREMAARHIGSALVVKRGKLAGIFTSTDACRHFAQFLQMFFDPGSDDVA
ncbi:MAG: CBS domain-containing protein [Myxococcota bacterium]